MAIFDNSPSSIQLLQRQIEALGELLEAERFERRAEVDLLKIENETLKKMLAELHPGFLQRFEETREQIMHSYDPETETKLNGETDQSKPSTLEKEEHALGAGD